MRFGIAVLFALTLIVGVASAQQTTATFYTVVIDSTGGSIPAAIVDTHS